MNLQAFPDAIRQLKILRIEQGLTQKNVADSMGISATSYNRKENGLAPFSQWEIEDLLNLFEVGYRFIFPESDSDE